MIDFRKYYLDNVKEDEYYYRFFDLIKNVNITYNAFTNYQIPEETGDATFFVYDEKEVINKFKELCQPANKLSRNEDKCWFYTVCFYLDRHGYYIEQFPNVLKRPPKEPHEFCYDQIRNWAFSHNMNNGNTISYATRRQIVNDMVFKTTGPSIEITESLDEQFRRISTRDARFQEMSTDEKIREIANLIENLLKKNGKFITPDYSQIAFDYINDDIIKKYRKQIQCFRHSAEDAVKERAGYSDSQKDFLIDYGIVICKTIYELVKSE